MRLSHHVGGSVRWLRLAGPQAAPLQVDYTPLLAPRVGIATSAAAAAATAVQSSSAARSSRRQEAAADQFMPTVVLIAVGTVVI
jgi:hypothetical protein